MTEHETNPQQPGAPDPGSPEQTAHLPRQDSGEPAGSGDADAGGAQRPVAEQSGPAAGPEPAGSTPAAPAAGPSSSHTPPGGPHSPSAGPWGPPAAAQPSPAPSGPPFAPAAPQAPQSPWRPAPAWQRPATGVPGSGVPGYEPRPAAAANQPPPFWTAQPGAGEAPTTAFPASAMPAPPRQPGRAGRRFAAGVAVLAVAVASGVLGGWVALQADDDAAATTSVGTATNASNRNSSPAPVINRNDLANVAAAVQPSVVSIKTEDGEGSGVVYDSEGDIVTNNHVVASADGDDVTVTFSDGKSVRGRIVNTDPRTDLAVVKVSDASGLTPAKIGDSGAMRVGDTVLALGSPLGLEGTVTAGIISALDRTITVSDEDRNPFRQRPGGVQSISGLLQTDAPINPGNSGGALANTKGEVIGINNAIAGSSGGNIGVGFAIPSNRMKAVADQLIKGEKVKHPFLGVSVTDATNGGALVQMVAPDSPAAKAGIQVGDVITKLGDKAINDQDDLVSAVQSGNVGDRLDITYTRNGDQQTATVTLADAS